MTDNALYCGYNLDLIPRYFKDETVKLVSLDPPVNSIEDPGGLCHTWRDLIRR